MVGNTVGLFGNTSNSWGLSLVSDWPGLYFNSYYNGGVRQMAPNRYAGFINSDPAQGNISFNMNDSPNTASGNILPGTLYNRFHISRVGGASVNYNATNVTGLTASSGGLYPDLGWFSINAYVATNNSGKGLSAAGRNIGVEGRADHIFTSTTDKMGGLLYVTGYNGGSTWGIPAVATVGSVIDNVGFKILGSGIVSTMVADENGKERIMVAPEAPEALFQDYGHATLANGYAKIEFDPVLAKNIRIDEMHPVKIFIQPEGKCNGLYVLNKNANGFEVREQQDGTSNIAFSYR